MGLLDRLLGRPTPERFAARIMDAIRRAGDASGLRYEPEEDRILRLEGDQVTGAMHLGNMYRTYLAKPRAERPAYLKTCIRGFFIGRRELPEDFDAARPDLRPKLWTRAGFERHRLEGRLGEGPSGPGGLPTIPLGEHLLAGLAYDWPEAVQSIGGGELGRWGVTLYEAMEAALVNLQEATEGYAKVGENLWIFASGDSYDATRLLLIDRLEGMDLRGRPVAMAPNRDTLLVAGEDDPEGLEMLIALGEEGLSKPYPMSGVPLVLDEGDWADWMPPPGHPLRRRFRDVELKWLGPEYATQKDLLGRLHEREGEDVSVATFSAVRKPDGELVSYCVWTEGIETILPVTNKVVLLRQDGEGPVALGDWERVAEAAGDLLEPTEHYPRRYRVRAFPDAPALEAIGLGEI